MKNYRLLIATVVALSAGACSGDVTTPAPAVPAAPASDAAPEPSTTAQPQVINPADPPPEDTGNVGSGCCAKG